jgi:hypothetical protein
MFRSWKKTPSAPCGGAYVLRRPIGEVLNQLCWLGPGTMVLRQQGLSLAKTTHFGLWVADEAQGWELLRDRFSRLETEMSKPQNVYLLAPQMGRQPLLAMGEPGQPIDLSIRLNCHTWGSNPIRDLLHRLDAVALDWLESCKLGAGAWLDDWGQASKPISDGERIREVSQWLRNCDQLELEIRSNIHRATAKFTPSFVDTEGAILRVADRFCRHVIYADVEAPHFQLTQIASRQMRICLEPAAVAGASVSSPAA